MDEQQAFARDAVKGLLFDSWLRKGSVPDDVAELVREHDLSTLETKGNPYHDPKDGRFTFAPGGAGGKHTYRGMTKHGVDTIAPTGGGGVDRNGRPRAELFPPDPYVLHSPQQAVAHYMSGSGEDRNYYMNSIDTSNVRISDFPAVEKLAKTASPGVYPIIDQPGKYNGDFTDVAHSSSWGTVGGLNLRPNGALAIDSGGRYQVWGRISADDDAFDFNDRAGRSKVAQAVTMAGRRLPGRPFTIHLVGSKPFAARGRR